MTANTWFEYNLMGSKPEADSNSDHNLVKMKVKVILKRIYGSRKSKR